MKKLIGLIGFLSFFMLNVSIAQSTSTEQNDAPKSAKPRDVMGHRLKKMIANFDLTDTQVTNLRVAHDDFAKKMSNFMAAGPDRKAIREKVLTWKGELQDAYRKELTKEQFVEWATAQKEAEAQARAQVKQ